MTEPDRLDAPNQQVVRADGSGPADVAPAEPAPKDPEPPKKRTATKPAGDGA